MKIEDRQKRFHTNLFIFVFLITCVSLINLFSATYNLGSDMVSKTFIAQCIWFGLGWIALLCFTFLNPKIFKTLAWPFYIVNLVFLILVQVIGKTSYGAQRWIDLGFFKYQPSETMKVALILVLAVLLEKKIASNSLNIKDLALPVLAALIPFSLTVIQPDLGTALIMVIITGSMALFVGVNKKIILALALIGTLSLPVVWSFGLKTYQKERILTFLNPSKDLRGGGYNSRQSKIAVGSGKFLGRGYKKGTQSQLEFLPERHTDFIYSVLSEEHGFLGSLFVLGLFFGLFLSILSTVQYTTDPFGSLVSFGVGSIILWHFFINICMVTGIMPVVGVPLPLLSYGGSAILTTMASLGMVSSIYRNRPLF